MEIFRENKYLYNETGEKQISHDMCPVSKTRKDKIYKFRSSKQNFVDLLWKLTSYYKT